MSRSVFVPSADEIVLSCPACEHWQLHYSPAELVHDVFATGPILEATVEALLREHVARDCPQPRLFYILARSRGVV